jgi:adenylate cyclase
MKQFIITLLKRFQHFYKNRTFSNDILFVFLILITISILSIVGYTYSKMTTSIMQFSEGTIERVSRIIVGRLNCMMQLLQKIPLVMRGLIEKPEDISLSNKQLISYMGTIMKDSNNAASIFVSTIEGNLLGFFNLHLSHQDHYVFTPSDSLPENSLYGLRWVEHTPSHTEEVWIYMDKDFKVLGKEHNRSITIDPVHRPWFEGAVQTRDFYLTDLYRYNPANIKGVTVSLPLFNKEEDIFAVLGVDLSLDFISEFLREQKIAEHGKAFILNNQGKILMEGMSFFNDVSEEEEYEFIEKAFIQFQKQEKENFVLRFRSAFYLISCHNFSVYGSKNWTIMVVAPMKNFFHHLMKTQKDVYMISLVILILSAICVLYFSKRLSTPVIRLAKEIDKIKQLNLADDFRIQSNIQEINIMDESIHSLRIALRNFEKYIPHEIIQQLMQQGKEIQLGGEQKEITIMFSDIAGFTNLASKFSPEYFMPLLTEYFHELSLIILKNGGTIDKYIGDSIMAFWGAPLEWPDHVEKACYTALLCRDCVQELNAKRRSENKPEFPTRFGINTGTVIVGNIGTYNRMNYTVIGDPVNTASKLQEINKQYDTQILVGKDVYLKIKDRFILRPVDKVQIAGKEEKMEIFELISLL